MKIKIFVIFCLVAQQSKALADTLVKQKVYGFHLGSSFILANNSEGFYYTPSFFIENKKKVFEIAPVFTNGLGRTISLRGATGSFSWFVNGMENKFNLFFKYQLMALFDKSFSGPYLWPYEYQNNTTYYLQSYQNFSQYYSNSVHYGFRWNVNKKLFIQKEFGLGIQNELTRTKIKREDVQSGSVNRSKFTNFETSPLFLVKLSVGLKF